MEEQPSGVARETEGRVAGGRDRARRCEADKPLRVAKGAGKKKVATSKPAAAQTKKLARRKNSGNDSSSSANSLGTSDLNGKKRSADSASSAVKAHSRGAKQRPMPTVIHPMLATIMAKASTILTGCLKSSGMATAPSPLSRRSRATGFAKSK